MLVSAAFYVSLLFPPGRPEVWKSSLYPEVDHMGFDECNYINVPEGFYSSAGTRGIITDSGTVDGDEKLYGLKSCRGFMDLHQIDE